MNLAAAVGRNQKEKIKKGKEDGKKQERCLKASLLLRRFGSVLNI